MQPHWTVLLCVILLWPAAASLAATTPLQRPKSVLILYHERPGTPAHLLLDQSLRATLTAKITDRLDFYAEYMDISRFPGEEHLQPLYGLYRRKYAGRTMDLIIAVTRRPLEFLLRHQQELFPGTPVVFCGVDPDTLTNLSIPSHMTGIVRNLDFKGTLALALTLHPRTKRVVLLIGTSPTDQYYRTLARSQLGGFEGTVEFIEMGPLPMSALLDRVAQLPAETIILYVLLFRDGAGESFLGSESMSLVAQAANAPLYGVFDALLGSGTVGSHVYSYEAVGK
jgi:hypothetical protein